MRIKFKKIEIQNFFSYGNKQTVDFTKFRTPIVLIDGIDKDTEGSKIGSGKSSFFAAITFALFGETVSDIRADGVVNYIKGKNTLVVLELDVNGKMYKIERGRKPNVLNFFVETDGEWVNISKSDIKETDQLIKDVIRTNFDTFLQITLFSVASENNKPFLNLRPAHQKKVLENIFNFDIFNLMIEEIKEDLKEKQIAYAELESTIKEVTYSNEQIKKQIERLEVKADNFEKEKEERVSEIDEEINYYSNIDIKTELEKHEFLDELKQHKNKVNEQIAQIKEELQEEKEKIINQTHNLENKAKEYERVKSTLDSLLSNVCPTCGQEWKDERKIKELEEKLESLQNEIVALDEILQQYEKQEKVIKSKLKEKKELLTDIKQAIDQIDLSLAKKELNNIEFIIEKLKEEKETLLKSENPYIQEIESNKKMIREIDMTEIDKLDNFIKGVKTYIKLSSEPKMRGKFLRKFIKQTNEILRQFKKMIPDFNIHIQFNKDFSIRIMKLGKEVSAGSLSNGEKRIGNIMIMMALMKVFKLKNNVEFDTMFMDEVLDSGINGTLLESVFKFIKNIAKTENTRILLISHREEIKEKIKEVVMVTKQRGISTIKVLSQEESN